jgi:hypothetical protein
LVKDDRGCARPEPQILGMADFYSGHVGNEIAQMVLQSFRGADEVRVPGIHNHETREHYTRVSPSTPEGMDFQVPRGACHRTGHFGPDPLARGLGNDEAITTSRARACGACVRKTGRALSAPCK